MKGKKTVRKQSTQRAGLGIPSWKEPSPQERIDQAAKQLVREIVEAHPGFERLAKTIGRTVRRGTGALIRGTGAGSAKKGAPPF